MKRMSILVSVCVLAFGLFASAQESICRGCGVTSGCYDVLTGWCTCHWDSEAHLCGGKGYCTGNACQEVDTDQPKVHPWIQSKTLADELSKVDEPMARLVGGLQRMLRKDPSFDRGPVHLKLGMTDEEPAEGTYDPSRNLIGLNYFVGKSVVSEKLTFTSKGWKLKSSDGSEHSGSF
jgi:hypothetical protein